MKTIKKILPLLIFVSLLGCEKGLMTFDNKNADVYFYDAGQALAALSKDSTYISFSYSNSPDSVVQICIAATGGKAHADRPYQIEVDPSSTAIEGIHFEALSKNIAIRKNQLIDTLRVKLLRTGDMQTNSYTLRLNLLPNAHFGTQFQSRAISGKKINTISTKLKFDDVLKKPARWQDAYWGVFTRKKLFYICDFFGFNPYYLEDGITVAESYSLPRMLQRHLNNLHAEGKTMYEEDGVTRMMMGSIAN